MFFRIFPIVSVLLVEEIATPVCGLVRNDTLK